MGPPSLYGSWGAPPHPPFKHGSWCIDTGWTSTPGHTLSPDACPTKHQWKKTLSNVSLQTTLGNGIVAALGQVYAGVETAAAQLGHLTI